MTGGGHLVDVLALALIVFLVFLGIRIRRRTKRINFMKKRLDELKRKRLIRMLYPVLLIFAVSMASNQAAADNEASLKITVTVHQAPATVNASAIARAPEDHTPERALDIHKKTIERDNDSVVLVTVTL